MAPNLWATSKKKIFEIKLHFNFSLNATDRAMFAVVYFITRKRFFKQHISSTIKKFWQQSDWCK